MSIPMTVTATATPAPTRTEVSRPPLTVATAVWFARRRGAIAPRDLGLRRARLWIAVGWILVGFVVARALSAGYAALVSFDDDASSKIGDGHGTLNTVLVVVCLAVIAPVFEELFFRGFLFAALSNWRGPWIGALASSLIFGAAHALGSDLAVLPVLAMSGFVFALVYWFTGSLVPAVALHSLNNSLALVVSEDWTWQIPVVIVGSLAVAMLLLTPLARGTPPREPEPAPAS